MGRRRGKKEKDIRNMEWPCSRYMMCLSGNIAKYNLKFNSEKKHSSCCLEGVRRICKEGRVRNRNNLKKFHCQIRLWESHICPFIYTSSLRKGFGGIRFITKMSVSH